MLRYRILNVNVSSSVRYIYSKLQSELRNRSLGMEVSIHELLLGGRVIQLIFADPILIVVTCGSIVINGKHIPIESGVVAATNLGLDKIAVVAANAVLSIFDVQGELILQKSIGTPGEWAPKNSTIVCSNLAGNLLAIKRHGPSMSLYQVSSNSVKYIGAQHVDQGTYFAQLLPSMFENPGGMLWTCSRHFGTVVANHDLLTEQRYAATLSLGEQPYEFTLPINGKDKTVLVSKDRAVLVRTEDVYSKTFSMPSIQLPGRITCASHTRLRSKSVQYLICGAKLYELKVERTDLELELICKSPPFLDLSKVHDFMVIPGSSILLFVWVGIDGVGGQFLLDENASFKQLQPIPGLSSTFECRDFVFDASSNCVLCFGKGRTLALASNGRPTRNLTVGCKTYGILDMFYVQRSLYVAFCDSTVLLQVSETDSGLALKQIRKMSSRMLQAGIVGGVLVEIYVDGAALIYDDHTEFVPLPITRAAISDACIAQRDNALCILDIGQKKWTEVLSVSGTVTFIRLVASQLLVGMTTPEIKVYDIGPNVCVQESKLEIPVDSVPHDITYSHNRWYIGYRDGFCMIFHPSDVEKPQKFKLGDDPVSFFGESETFVQCSEIFTLEPLSPLVCHSSRKISTIRNVVAACQAGDRVIVADQTSLNILNPINTSQSISLSVDAKVLAVEHLALQRAWCMLTTKGIIFLDTKYNVPLKSSLELGIAEECTALAVWKFEQNNNTYIHLVIATKKDGRYCIRTFSIERTKAEGVAVIKLSKRNKAETELRVDKILPIGTHLIIVQNTVLQILKLEKLDGRYQLSKVGDAVFEDRIMHVSENTKKTVLVSSRRGLYVLNIEYAYVETSPRDMINRMRDCITHLQCSFADRNLILCAERNCFLTVLELVENKWTVVQRIDKPVRILRMRKATTPLIPDGKLAIVALTSNGSFEEISFGNDIQSAPYLF